MLSLQWYKSRDVLARFGYLVILKLKIKQSIHHSMIFLKEN